MSERRSILVVDDAGAVLHLAESMLRRCGYQVACANNGQDALQILKRREFDLILLDVVMEGMSGLETARAIRLIHPGLPVVFMTGFPEYLENLDAQHETVVEKPFTAERLAAAVAKSLRRTKAAAGAQREGLPL